MPLVHSPGHAQADFGEAMAVIGGEERKVHFLAFDLPHSDGCFVKAYPAETTEAFCDGHNAAFAFFGGAKHGGEKNPSRGGKPGTISSNTPGIGTSPTAQAGGWVYGREVEGSCAALTTE